MQQVQVIETKADKSLKFCLALPFVIMILLSIIETSPNNFPFVFDKEVMAKPAEFHSSVIREKLPEIVDKFKKVEVNLASSVEMFFKSVTAQNFAMALFPFGILTVFSLLLSTYAKLKSIWALSFINMGIIYATVLPLVVMRSEYLNPIFALDPSYPYALATLYVTAFSAVYSVIAFFLFKDDGSDLAI
jgi:hypothetical protein